MRWSMGRRSSNVEDRRGRGMPVGFPRSRAGRAGGIGGLGAIAIVLIGLFLGIDPGVLLNMTGGPDLGVTQEQTQGPPASPQDQELADFAAVVLGETELTWQQLFEREGQRYREPSLVLYSGTTQTACGYGQAAAGPFYCPGDQKVYLDLSFFEEMERRFQAPGDFAQAYVIAHEVGHHVQTLLGVTQEVEAFRRSVGRSEANEVSVRFELQADCLAGVWANHTEGRTELLEPGDIEEALGAATAIGDDRLQRQSQGYVVPDAFTHGSSEQRARWFFTGYRGGDMSACDTFAADPL